MKQIRQRLTYANVMSSIAVFLLVGGATAYAALGKNTVGSDAVEEERGDLCENQEGSRHHGETQEQGREAGQELVDGAVGDAKIADGAVTNSKIANGAVTNNNRMAPDQQQSPGAVTGDKIAAGTVTTTNISDGALIPRGYAWVDATGKINPDLIDQHPRRGSPFRRRVLLHPSASSRKPPWSRSRATRNQTTWKKRDRPLDGCNRWSDARQAPTSRSRCGTPDPPNSTPNRSSWSFGSGA